MEKIGFQAFVKEVATKLNYTQKDVREVLRGIDDIVLEHLKNGDQVRVTPSVTFDTTERKERTARNIVTGEPVKVPSRVVPKAKFSEPFKRELR